MEKKPKLKISEYNRLVDFNDYEPLTPLQAIKLKCKECCAFQSSEVLKCEIKDCALNQFINKKRNYNISDEERERRRKIFKKNE